MVALSPLASVSASLFKLAVSGVPEVLHVLSFTGHEALSSLFEFQVELASADPAIDFTGVVGKTALLTVIGEPLPRFFHGIISRFEQVNELPHHAVYQATLVPRVWKLTHRQDCRIFQELSTPGILKKVFETAGIPADSVRYELTGTYEPRNYCVQYRESDWNFINRLMEEDGLFYFFDHGGAKDVLVVGDGPPACKPLPAGEALQFRRPDGMVVTGEHVQRFRFAEEVQPGSVALRDFNFKKPSQPMQVQSKASVNTDLEVYDYPGEYQDPGYGATAKGLSLSKLRLEAWQAARRVAHGESDCERLCPGFMFTLKEHPRDSYNDRYLLTRVSHQGQQPQVLEQEGTEGSFSYSNQFSCIPARVPFRPARDTPRPVVRGLQTAIVVGPEGEEIYVDEHGRVKAQFHWDRQGKRDENSSCWIRVSQVWAGEAWGAMFIPRIGQEVVVDFIEGDPDRPLITGRVYNGEQIPPYKLPEQKTKSTLKSNSSKGGEGYNELRFEDAKKREQVFIHAQRNMDVHVKNDSLENILHDRHQTIGSQGKEGKVGDQNELVYRDKSLTVHRHSQEHVGGDMKLLVGGIDGAGNVDIVIKAERKEFIHASSHLKVTGDLNEQVGGTLSLSVTGGLQTKVGAKHALEAAQELHLKSDKIVIEATTGLTIKGPGGFITIDAGGIAISGNLVKINSGGSALSGSGADPKAPAEATEARPVQPTPADNGRKP